MQTYNRARGTTGLNANQLIKSKQARNSFISLTTEIRWLLPKFEKFLPQFWYHGVVLLALRLLQTSFMVLVPSQLVQASVMCCVTLVAILLQSELSPYRRASDNHVALLAQVLLFCWVFVLMLRIVGVFNNPVAATTIGLLLCVATAAVFVAALILADMDRRNDKHAKYSDSNEMPTVVSAEESNNETSEKEPEEVEAGQSQGHESPAEEEKIEHPESSQPSSSSPWSLLALGSGTLCGAETTDDTAPVVTGQFGFDELANLALAAGVDRSEVSRLARVASTGEEGADDGDDTAVLLQRMDKLAKKLAMKDNAIGKEVATVMMKATSL